MEVTLETSRPDDGPSNFNRTQKHLSRRRWISRRRKAAPRSASPSPSSEGRGKNLIPTPPCHPVVKYMAPLVLSLVTLKYQGKTESLFEDNPVPAWCLLLATFVYYLIVGVAKQMSTLKSECVRILINRAALASGVLSAVSLLSIFLPYEVSLVPLIMWTPLPIVLAWPILHPACNWLRAVTTSVVDNIWGGRGKSLREEASLPV